MRTRTLVIGTAITRLCAAVIWLVGGRTSAGAARRMDDRRPALRSRHEAADVVDALNQSAGYPGRDWAPETELANATKRIFTT